MGISTVSRQHGRFLYVLVAVSLFLGLAGPAQVLAGREVRPEAASPMASSVELDGTVSTIERDSPPTSSSGTTSPLTFSHTTGSGVNRLLMVSVSWSSTSVSVNGVTWNSVALTLAGTSYHSTQPRRTAIYYLVAPAASTTADVVVTFSSSVSAVAGAVTFRGVSQGCPVGTFLGATGNSGTASVSPATTPGDLVFDTVVAGNTTLTLPDGSNQTSQWNALQGTTVRGAASTETATGTPTQMSWTLGASGYWATGAVAIKPASTAVRCATADDVQIVNVSHTTGTGTNRLMLVGVSWNSDTAARTISSITFSYGAEPTVLNLTEKITQKHGSNNRYAAIWYSPTEPPSGTSGTVTVNFSEGTVTAGIVVGVANFAGVYQTTPLGISGGAYSSSNNTTPTVTLSGLAGDELVFDTIFLGGNPPASLTAGTGQTELTGWNGYVANARGVASTEDANSNTSVTMSWTASSNSMWVTAAAAINPAPVGTTHDLTVAVDPSGGGTTTPAVGPHTYVENTVVNISATPATGYAFDYWDGDVADPYSASTTVTMNANKTVTAHFAALPQYTLTVGTTGSGSVALSPAGGTYYSGTTVTLTPTAGACYAFDGWSGADSDDILGSGPYTIYMDEDKSVTADFAVLAAGIPCYRVNAGGPTLDMVSDPDFLALQYANLASIPGLTVSNVSGERSTTNTIDMTNVDPSLPMALFQTVLYRDNGLPAMTFDFDVPNGAYELLLHWAEHNFSSADQRTFDVSVEGVEVFSDYDIFVKAGGQNKAVTESVPTTVSDGVLNLAINPQISVAIIRGIEIVLMDTTPPDTSIDSGPSDPSASASASFSFSSSEAGSTFECQLDSGGFSACTNPKTYTGLSDGSHTFQVRATDAASNVDATPATYAWTIDRTAPVLTIAGFTADGNSMAVVGGGGYILPTTNVGTINHEVQFEAVSSSSEPLAGLTGLYLDPTSVDVAGLTAYYTARIPDGSPAEALAYRAYLIAALDGVTHPFAYVTTDGSNKLVLHDAAQYDLAGNLTVGMIVPDDYPLGTYPVQGTAKDAGGNGAAVSLSLIVTGDRTAPTLDLTGATADGTAMAGDPENGYTLPTTNDPADDWLIQFADGTSASETLANEYFGLYLTDSTVSADFLKAYYTWKGVPEPYLTYLKDAADSTNPFVYIRGSTVTLVDAAKRDLQTVDDPMTVPDTFPSGTYTVQGVIRDLAGNETTVTLILKVAGPAPSAPNAPAVSIVKLGSDVQLSWPAVQTDTNDNFIVVTTYQVFRSSVPYFTPDPTPGTGNLEYEGPNLTYLHDEAAGSVGMYFYIVRAVNSIGPSANSRRVGVFTFQLVPGQ